MLRKIFPDAKIHSFEPGHKTFQKLQENTRECNAILNNFGLSNCHKNLVLHYDKEGSTLASLYQRQLDHFHIDFSKSETVTVDTLDFYCAKNEIDHIDLLKMDVEGAEIDLLDGATHMLEERRIKAIQFEFGGCNIDSRTFFRDFWNRLHESYRIYRIMCDGLVEIPNYDERLEIFSYQNIFCEIREEFMNV